MTHRDRCPRPRTSATCSRAWSAATVAVSPGAPVTPTPDRPVSVAVYVAPDMSVNALCLMDLGASAYTAGGLALLPPGGCQDAVEEDGELSGMLVEALHEVVNMLSALFNTPGAPHSKLHKLYAPGRRARRATSRACWPRSTASTSRSRSRATARAGSPSSCP